jgi:hypothetical protein
VLSEWFVTDDLSALVWFLQHSPVLEKLTLRILEVIIYFPKRIAKVLSVVDTFVELSVFYRYTNNQ